jgi:hypothetical protein
MEGWTDEQINAMALGALHEEAEAHVRFMRLLARLDRPADGEITVLLDALSARCGYDALRDHIDDCQFCASTLRAVEDWS